MRSKKFLLYIFLALLFLVPACRGEKENKDFSGVSELIAERNRARYDVAENTPKKSSAVRKTTSNETKTSETKTSSKKEALSSVILYEQDIKVVGSESGRTLAKGVAYINKQGQIVRIKILKE